MWKSRAIRAGGIACLLVSSVHFWGSRAEAGEVQHPTRVYWGDTHVHSSYSLDANMFGNTQLTPESAYRFAKGETIDVGAGQMVRLARPLDFLVVADHAELLGFLPMIRSRDPEVMRYAAAGRAQQRVRLLPLSDFRHRKK